MQTSESHLAISPMWSSQKSGYHKNNKSFSSSASSSTSSSSSSNPKPLKTMEEVWKDINVPSLPGEDTHITNLNIHGVKLQDFLAQPFAKNPQKTSMTMYTSPPTHVFNLNFGPDFNFDEPDEVSTLPNDIPYEGFASNSTSKKRVTDQDENIGDRRYKRMIKNRESAARSRARKQAYRFELEGKLAILREENKRLKKQQQVQLCLEETSQAPTKKPLCRTSTAPF